MCLVELFERFPDEQAAKRWFEKLRWPEGERRCFRCQAVGCVHDGPHAKPMPYRCGTCQKYFSLRTGSLMKHSELSLRIRAIAVYLLLDLPKGVSSIQLAKLLGITQKSAWFLGHRIRKAFARPEAQVYTDTSRIYDGLDPHESVNHSRGEYVRGEAHTNGIESFRALLKPGYHGTCHSMSRKRLHRYVNEFTGRYNSRGKSLLDRMAELASGMVGQGLTYKELVA